MNTRTRRTSTVIAAAALALVAFSGCANQSDKTPGPKATGSPSVSVVPKADVTEAEQVPDPRRCATNIAGADDDGVVDRLVEKWMSITLGSTQVVTGAVKPSEVALSLPLQDLALKHVKREPTSMTLVSFTDPSAGRVGLGAEVVCVRGSSTAIGTGVEDRLEVILTADFRVTYAERGDEKTLDGSRVVRLELVPSTDTSGDQWWIADRGTGTVKWSE